MKPIEREQILSYLHAHGPATTRDIVIGIHGCYHNTLRANLETKIRRMERAGTVQKVGSVMGPYGVSAFLWEAVE